MSRIKRGTVSRQKHNKVLTLARGYRGAKRKLIRTAKQAVLHAGAYAYHGRKRRKQDFRRLWITRISEASAELGVPYSQFIANLKKKHVELDRKILADLVVNDPATFKAVLDKSKTV